MTTQWLKDILEKQTFLHYHAFFDIFKHNHKTEGIVALARITNSKEIVERYVERSEENVPRYHPGEELENATEGDQLKLDNVTDYLGKNQGFYRILEWYKSMYENKYNRNIQKMVQDVYPGIIDGPLLGAFHGIIQLGYGLAALSDSMAVEGIAYTFHQYFPFFKDDMQNPKRTDMSKFGRGSKNLEDILIELRDSGIGKTLHEENAINREERLRKNEIGYGWSTVKCHSELFMNHVDSVKLPDWYSPDSKSEAQLKKLMDWLLDTACVLYVKSNKVNDFFLLHGITSSWSARHVFQLLDYDSALFGVRSLLAGFIAVYAEQDTPALEKTPEDYFTGDVNQKVWDEFIAELCHADVTYEVHIYKVSQCLYERWQENPDSEYTKYYFAGACIAKNYGYNNRGIESNKKLNK